jgi:hypothetical protein
MNKPIIVDPNGKPIQSDRFAPCPKCGSGSDRRVPSSGFGTPHLVCFCGYEFEGRLLCQTVTP